jgi:BlaR1 peptidase M56
MIGLATGALVAAAWQGVLLAAVVWAGLRMLPKTPAAVRFAIWFGVFLVVTALPLASLWPHSAGAVQAGGRGVWLTLDMRWSLAIAGVWAAASLVRAGKLVVAAVRVRGLWKRARPVGEKPCHGVHGRTENTVSALGLVEFVHPTHDDKTVMNGAPGDLGGAKSVTAGPSTPLRSAQDDNFEMWADVTAGPSTSLRSAQDDSFELWADVTAGPSTPLRSAQAGPSIPLRFAQDGSFSSGNRAGRRAELCVSDEVDRPTVIGFFAPKILIPAWLLEKLTPTELDQIVLHETGHLGRADDWMNLLQKIALVIFPLNPALAWVERRLCFERELAVDDCVLRAFGGKAGAATAYAACLATVAEHRLGRRGLALALGALGRESELGRRVRRILDRRETMRPAHARLVLGGALMGLLSAGMALERCPQVVGFAQNQGIVAMADVVNVDGSLRGRVGNRVNVLRAGTDGSHEVLLKAEIGAQGFTGRAEKSGPQRLKPQSSGAAYGTAEAVPLTKAQSGLAPAVKVYRAESLRWAEDAYREVEVADGGMSRPELQARITQWVVVTSWQGADGSRMVMTSEMTQNPAARASRTVSDMAPGPEQDSEQTHPYAAVPVRGGWLIVQL